MPFNIQNMCGNGGGNGGGQTSGGSVSTVNRIGPGADGNVTLQAANVGAAVMGLNWQSLTKRYIKYVANATDEPLEPMKYLFSVGNQGCFFIRTDDGLHFCVVANVGNSTALKTRVYLFVPNNEDGAGINGGVYIGNMRIMRLHSDSGLDDLMASIMDSPIATIANIDQRLAASSVSPEDLTEAYAAWLVANSRGTPETFFHTIAAPGVYTLSDGHGYWYCCRIFEAVDEDDTEIYCLLLKMASAETGVSVKLLNSGFEHQIAFASGITVPEPKDDSDAATKKYVDQKEKSLNAKISARPTKEKAKEIANEEAARIVLEALPLSEMSTVSTRLQKYTEQSVRYIKIELLNKSFLESCYSGGHTVKLHFFMCSRKHGKGHHWWHPSNYNVDPELGAPFRIGYGQLAGTWRDEKKTKAFPQVPSWMPNSGWVETEIKLTHNDLVYGYKLIDPTVYFLPMIKPSKINENNEWGQDIDFVSVQTAAANSGRRFMPILCTWVVAIDGIDVGRPLDVLRIGCTRDIGHHTMVKTEHGQTTLKNLYISIK